MLPIGPLLAAGASLLGGYMQNKATSDANAAAAAQAAMLNKQQMKVARQNILLQKQFAQEGIQWKVADAKRAGIHPLYALGASTASYSPVSVGSSSYSPIPETGLAQGLASAGQDISRAVTSVLSPSERQYQDAVRALDLQRMGLSNELLKSQIARERQVTMPGVPADPLAPAFDYRLENEWTIPHKGASALPRLGFWGMNWRSSNRTSGAKDVQDHYGDEGPVAYFAGVPKLLDDLYLNSLLGRWMYPSGQFPQEGR